MQSQSNVYTDRYLGNKLLPSSKIFWEKRKISSQKNNAKALILYKDLRNYSRQYDTYYIKNLLKNMFRRWKNAWWYSQVQWKLLLRATCCYKFRLKIKYFVRWKMYILLKIEKLRNKIRSLEFYAQHLLESCFKKIRLRYFVKKCLKEAYFLNEQIILILLIKQKYLVLMKEDLDKYLTSSRDMLALQLWSERLQCISFRLWKQFTKEKIKVHKMDAIAFMCWKEIMEIKYFIFWRKYFSYRRTKQQIYKISDGLYISTLRKRCISWWHQKYAEELSLKAISKNATTFCQNNILRKYLNYWKMYQLYKNENKQKHLLANSFQSFNLKKKGLNNLRYYCIYKKNLKSLCFAATAFEQKLLLKTSWKKWTCFIEMQEEAKYTSLYDIATLNYRKSLLVKCFKSMIWFKEIQMNKSDLLVKGWEFSMKTIAKRYLQYWKKKMHKVKYYKAIEEEGTSFFTSRIIKRVIRGWKFKWFEMKDISKLEIFALEYCEENILHKSFAIWLFWYNNKKKIKLLKLKALQFDEINLKQLTINGWKRFLMNKKKKIRFYKIGEEMFQKILKRNTYNKWYTYKAYMNIEKQKADVFKDTLKKRKIHNILIEWKNLKNEYKNLRNMCIQFCLKQSLKIKSKTFSLWTKFILLRHKKRLLYSHIMHQAAKSWNEGIKRDFIQRWIEIYNKHQYEMLLKENASNNYQNIMKRCCFAAWKCYHANSQGIKMLKEKVKHFQVCFFIKRCFEIWKMLYLKKSSENHHLLYATTMWKKWTQDKSLKKWKSFCIIKEEKRKEYLQANDYHAYLLKEVGVSQWIRASIIIDEKWKYTSIQKILQLSIRHFQLGIKYGELWKRKTLTYKLKCSTTQVNDSIKKQGNQKLPKMTVQLTSSKNVDYSLIKELNEGFSYRTKPRIPLFLTM